VVTKPRTEPQLSSWAESLLLLIFSFVSPERGRPQLRRQVAVPLCTESIVSAEEGEAGAAAPRGSRRTCLPLRPPPRSLSVVQTDVGKSGPSFPCSGLATHAVTARAYQRRSKLWLPCSAFVPV